MNSYLTDGSLGDSVPLTALEGADCLRSFITRFRSKEVAIVTHPVLLQMGPILTVLGLLSAVAVVFVIKLWSLPEVKEIGVRPGLVCLLVMAIGVLIASIGQRSEACVVWGTIIAILGYFSAIVFAVMSYHRLCKCQST
jgi:hypothetical protein